MGAFPTDSDGPMHATAIGYKSRAKPTYIRSAYVATDEPLLDGVRSTLGIDRPRDESPETVCVTPYMCHCSGVY